MQKLFFEFGTLKRKIYKNKKNEEHFRNVPLGEKSSVEDLPIDEISDVNPLQEFIDLTKLQNDVLRKMLENIPQSENTK